MMSNRAIWVIFRPASSLLVLMNWKPPLPETTTRPSPPTKAVALDTASSIEIAGQLELWTRTGVAPAST